MTTTPKDVREAAALRQVKAALAALSAELGDTDRAVIDGKLVRFVARKLAIVGPVQGPVGPAEPSPDTRPSWSY